LQIRSILLYIFKTVINTYISCPSLISLYERVLQAYLQSYWWQMRRRW